jgi:hypothetical protein
MIRKAEDAITLRNEGFDVVVGNYSKSTSKCTVKVRMSASSEAVSYNWILYMNEYYLLITEGDLKCGEDMLCYPTQEQFPEIAYIQYAGIQFLSRITAIYMAKDAERRVLPVYNETFETS